MQREQEQTLSTPGVIEKYQAAAKVCNDVLAKLIKKISVGSKIIDLCIFGDNAIYEELAKIASEKHILKGLAFPTCISVNEVCAYFSPLPQDSINIKQGDLVKIQLGAHFDGFPALVAHTIVVQSDVNAQIQEKKAQVILAAYKAVQAALRLIKPGFLNNKITETIAKICQTYQVTPLQGIVSHQIKKHLIDGNKVILNKETFDQKVKDYKFNVNDVFALNIFVSTGQSKPKEVETRCTVYKRAPDLNYNLKIKQSRKFLDEVLNRFPTMLFSLNAFQDNISAKIGIKECLQHDLLISYPVLAEKPGCYVAQFKFTVMIIKEKTIALTGFPLDEKLYKTEKKIKDSFILELLAQSMEKKFKKNTFQQCSYKLEQLDSNSQNLKNFQAQQKIKIQRDTGINATGVKVQWNTQRIDKLSQIIENNPTLEKKLKLHPFFQHFRLSPAYFDPRGNNQFRNQRSDVEFRGGWPYYQPIKCKRYGLNVSKKYDNGNDQWLSMKGEPGQWAVAFHGINIRESFNNKISIIESIMSGLDKGQMLKAVYHRAYMDQIAVNIKQPVGRGIYCSPYIYECIIYANDVNIRQKSQSYRLIFQCRVNPSKIKVCEKQQLWVINESKNIRPYGIILIKENDVENYPTPKQQFNQQFKYEQWFA